MAINETALLELLADLIENLEWATQEFNACGVPLNLRSRREKRISQVRG